MLDPHVRQEATVALGSSLGAADGWYHVAKRVIDVVVSAIGLVVLSPLFVASAIAIRLDTSGPIFYRQQRIGSRRVESPDGHRWEPATFTFYKLRTMVAGASHDLHRNYIAAYINGDREQMAATAGQAAGAGTFKLVNDPRLTRVGVVLRRLSVDELPQLWNVLRGDMSLVGPRPALEYEVEMYEERHYRRLAAKPGITGLWQVSGRSDIGFEEMIELDCEYIRRRSLGFDLLVLLRTIPAVLSMRGAG